MNIARRAAAGLCWPSRLPDRDGLIIDRRTARANPDDKLLPPISEMVDTPTAGHGARSRSGDYVL